MGSSNDIKPYKILVIGESGVGKTCLSLRFTKDNFDPSLISATVGVNYTTKTLTIGEKTIQLDIWDTAGQERYRTIIPSYYRQAHGAILMYDVTRRPTFQHLENWLRDLDTNSTNPKIVKMVIGNKIDMIQTREVLKHEGINFAKKHKALFQETSALSADGITEAFNNLAYMIVMSSDLTTTNRPDIIHVRENEEKPESSCCRCGSS